jgi:HAE1 family hydrophobic/amphiphilic exporter-1
MWFTRISIANPVLAAVMMLVLVVLGVTAYKRLPIEQFPDVSFPVVVVQTAYPGASPEAVEDEVTRRVEESVNSVAGIKTLSSRSYEGVSLVIVEFELTVDAQTAAQEVREKVAAVRAQLRDEVEDPVVSRFNPDDLPVISVALRSRSASLRDLTTFADQRVKRRLETVRGVGKVSLVGGTERQVNVDLSLPELIARRISPQAVVAAISGENQDLPVGGLESQAAERVVQLKGRFERTEDLGRLIVERRGGKPVLLSELATVQDGEKVKESGALVDGAAAVALDVVKARGENTIAVVEEVKRALEELRPQLPPGVSIEVVRDGSISIRNSVRDVQSTLLEGGLLTILIVFLFLASWRSTVITGLTLPISLIGAFAFIYFFGFSLNTLTLMALSLCVGLLIDDAIVVRENIVRHTAMGKDHRSAALEGTREIGLAVLATTLSIVAVFLPVGFMGGIIGRFFHQFGLTVVAAILISMFVSFTLDPMLSAIWRDPQAEGRFGGGPIGRMLAWFARLTGWLSERYGRLLHWALLHRKSVIAIALASFFGSFPLIALVGTEFVTEPDLNELQLRFTTPVGSSLELTEAKVRQVDAALREYPQVRYTYATVNTGQQLGKNSVNMFVQLTPKEQRALSHAQLARGMRGRLARIPGVEVQTLGAFSAFGTQKPIQVSVRGPVQAELDRIAGEVTGRMRQVRGLIDVESSSKASKPALDVRLRRELASEYGVGLSQVGAALRPLLAGQESGTWRGPDGEYYDIVVRLPEGQRANPADLQQVHVASARTDQNGAPVMVPLREVADLVPATIPEQINRKNQTREILLTANVVGRPPGDAGTELQSSLRQLQLPAGYQVVLEGATRDMQESAAYAGQALILAVVFIYFVLAAQFGSFVQPISIMASLPLALIGVVLALLTFGSTLNIFSIIGFVMLMGLVTKNAILLVDFVNRARAEGTPRVEAVLLAGRIRLRPILMTTLAMVFGMMPLALGLGASGEQRAPMGQAVIGGVLASSLLTLVVVPVLYTYIDDALTWAKRQLVRKPFAHEGAA